MKKIFPIVFSLLVCLSFVLSLVDGEELPVKSDFNHDNIYSHIENICADGTHSIVHDEVIAVISVDMGLKKYAPENMEYDDYEEGYICETKMLDMGISSLVSCEGNTVDIKPAHEDSAFEITVHSENATYVIIDNKTNIQTVGISDYGYAFLTVYDDCEISLVGGTGEIFVTECIVDYPALIPENYDPEDNLHFNLWLQKAFVIS